MVDVENVVRHALMVLSRGPAAARYSPMAGCGGGWSGSFEMADREAAVAVLEALMQLELGRNLALMAWVHRDNIREGPAYLADLASIVRMTLGVSGVRYGEAMLEYLVRHWMRNDGSFSEASRLYGWSDQTVRRFYLSEVLPLLRGWHVAARGEMERVIERYYPELAQAAA